MGEDQANQQVQYSFCEPVTATPYTPWHIRPLTSAGQKLGGGADTQSLCGRQMGWDLAVPLNHYHLIKNACLRCAEIYEALKK